MTTQTFRGNVRFRGILGERAIAAILGAAIILLAGCPALAGDHSLCRFFGVGHGKGYHACDCQFCPGNHNQFCHKPCFYGCGHCGGCAGAYNTGWGWGSYAGYAPYYSYLQYYGTQVPPYSTTNGPPVVAPLGPRGAVVESGENLNLAPGEVLVTPPVDGDDNPTPADKDEAPAPPVEKPAPADADAPK